MPNYITKDFAEKNPAKGEINEDPSMTIEGEYMEMKDILNFAKRGSDLPQNDVQYFRPDDIQQINSLFKNSLDLTDLDSLQQKTSTMDKKIKEAVARKEKEKQELQEELEKNQITEPEPEKPAE